MVDGLVAPRRLDTADEGVDRIFAEGQVAGVVGPSEIAIHGLSNQGGKRHSTPPGLVLELPIGRHRKAEVCRHVSSHRDTTISPRPPVSKDHPESGAEPSASWEGARGALAVGPAADATTEVRRHRRPRAMRPLHSVNGRTRREPGGSGSRGAPPSCLCSTARSCVVASPREVASPTAARCSLRASSENGAPRVRA
jgi:hypothetical protein